jgi:hypothetical protein
LKRFFLIVLLALVLFTLLSFGAWMVEEAITDAKGEEAKEVAAVIRTGMGQEAVEGLLNRQPDFLAEYGAPVGTVIFSQNWWVNGYRLEVVYENGQVSNTHVGRPDPGPVARFVGAVFFWWVPSID